MDRVFALIYEGESLPVSCEKELKVITATFSWLMLFTVILSLRLLQLLRDRSMLYCICRRPYGQRAMIACDKCDEWYHFDCVKISSAPKVYICPACNPCPIGDMPPSELTAQDRQVLLIHGVNTPISIGCITWTLSSFDALIWLFYGFLRLHVNCTYYIILEFT